MNKQNQERKVSWEDVYSLLQNHANINTGMETEWKKERTLFLEKLNDLGTELQEQKRVNKEMEKRLNDLERSSKQKENTRAKPKHRKTHSDLFSNRLEQLLEKNDDQKKLEGMKNFLFTTFQNPHRQKKSLDDHYSKKKQYKLLRRKQGKPSSFGGVFGSGGTNPGMIFQTYDFHNSKINIHESHKAKSNSIPNCPNFTNPRSFGMPQLGTTSNKENPKIKYTEHFHKHSNPEAHLPGKYCPCPPAPSLKPPAPTPEKEFQTIGMKLYKIQEAPQNILEETKMSGNSEYDMSSSSTRTAIQVEENSDNDLHVNISNTSNFSDEEETKIHDLLTNPSIIKINRKSYAGKNHHKILNPNKHSSLTSLSSIINTSNSAPAGPASSAALNACACNNEFKSSFLFSQQNEYEQQELLTQRINTKLSLRAHLDGVRDLQFQSHLPFIASVSEDCLLKLWDLSALYAKKSEVQHTLHMDPYFTFRGHTGALFTTTTGASCDTSLLYTAGSEGVIRIWAVPQNIQPFQQTYGKTHCAGVWTSHRDIIWQLIHHPKEGLLLSVSSDGTVKMWKEFDLTDTIDSIEKNSNDCLLGSFVYRPGSQPFAEIPTSASWIHTNHNALLISYRTPVLALFDRITGKNKGVLKYEMNFKQSLIEQQINKVITHPSMPMAITAHENKFLRFYDINNFKNTKSMIAHVDSVTCLSISESGNYLFSGGHDGSLRCWDLRKYQCIYEIPAHRKKFDEGVFALAVHPSLPYLASGGADGIIKIYEHSL